MKYLQIFLYEPWCAAMLAFAIAICEAESRFKDHRVWLSQVRTSVLKIPFLVGPGSYGFPGRVPGYSRRWAIIGDSTKISTFTNLKRTQIMGSNHLLYISSATFLHSKQHNTEEMLTKKRFLYIQNTVVYCRVHKSGVT